MEVEKVRKKILVFVSVLSVCLYGVFNIFNVSAVTGDYYYKSIIFHDGNDWETVSIDELTFRVVGYLDVPGIDVDLDVNEAIFIYTTEEFALKKGEQYMFESTVDPEVVFVSITLSKAHYEMWCVANMLQCNGNDPDDSTLHLYMSEYFFGYYLSVYSSDDVADVMKNFLLAELYEDFAYEDTIGLEKYYVYLDAQVYLPDGTKRSITVMPDVIDDNAELFEGYDFIAVSFNLSPRAQFWSPSIYPNDPIVGLSYIVYDLVANTTSFYNYQGNLVVQLNGIVYLDTPQFSVPEAEAMQYREKSAYEQGKNEGYKQGREEGERAGKRKMQEEMEQVIENLTEYYEQELIKAYNRGKLEGANEEFDIFGYLQALFGEQGLGRLLRLELLPGVSLGAVIMIPLAFWLVSFIMRWFR